MDKKEFSNQITEEELVEFWNSYFFEKKDKAISEIMNQIKESLMNRNLSSAYGFSKQLCSMIANKMIENKETMKVVINDGWGGFALSIEALRLFADLKKIDASEVNVYKKSFMRHDEDLIKVVETMGSKANAICSNLKIVEIPKGINYKIYEHDGWEKVVY